VGKLRWYKRDPDAALAGMAELTLIERGAYNSILDLLYSRDGIVADNDALVARMIGCHWREWRAVKNRLIQRGKIRVEDGHLTANRVQETLKEAASFSQDQSRRASSGWHKRKNLNKNNVPPMPPGNASTTTTTTTKEDNSIKGANAPLPNPEKELFRRGKEVLKNAKAGGFIAKLLAATGKDAVEALGIVEMAAETENPKEYIGAIIAKGAKNGNGNYSQRNGRSNGHDFFARMASVKNGTGQRNEPPPEPSRGPTIDLRATEVGIGPSGGFGGLLGLPNAK
jgi:uncharacterized protein YdaU (DUF1376 family)